jgi:hypothetical protein
MTSINWTRPMLERFKKAYEKARSAEQDTFEFDGNQFVVNYAKYLIQHLDSQLGP